MLHNEITVLACLIIDKEEMRQARKRHTERVFQEVCFRKYNGTPLPFGILGGH